MGKKISTSLATCALTICAVSHIWAIIELFRNSALQRMNSIHMTSSVPLVTIYMAAVCLFNWFAVSSGSENYRKTAMLATGLHLICAVIEGAAGQALALSGVEEGGWIATVGIAIPSVVNLPFNSLSVMQNYSSMIPWVMTAFFAVNLVVILAHSKHELDKT